MTPPEPDDDRLLDALLDGDASPDEAARVDADPALRARLEQLRAVRAALAPAPDELPAAGREDRITRALAVAGTADPTTAGTADPTTAGTVAGRAPSPRLRRALVAVAAAVVVLVVVGASIVRSGDGDRTTTASSGDSTTAAGPGAASTTGAAAELATPDAGGAQAQAGSAAPPAASAATPAPDLGAFPDVAALRAALGPGGARYGTDSSTAKSAVAAPCLVARTAQRLQLVGTATVAGAPVLVTARPDGALVVLAASTCAPSAGG